MGVVFLLGRLKFLELGIGNVKLCEYIETRCVVNFKRVIV